MTCPSGTNRPPARPCATRTPISTGIDGAAAHAALATANPTTASRKVLRVPTRSTSQPLTGSDTARASRYPVTTHCATPTRVCRSRLIVSRATDTTVESNVASKPVNTAT